MRYLPTGIIRWKHYKSKRILEKIDFAIFDNFELLKSLILYQSAKFLNGCFQGNSLELL